MSYFTLYLSQFFIVQVCVDLNKNSEYIHSIELSKNINLKGSSPRSIISKSGDLKGRREQIQNSMSKRSDLTNMKKSHHLEQLKEKNFSTLEKIVDQKQKIVDFQEIRESKVLKIEEERKKLEEIEEEKKLQEMQKLSALRKEKIKKIRKSFNSPSVLSQQYCLDVEKCINRKEVKKIIRENPWDVDVLKSIESFKKKKFPNPEKRFRIGGRMIYSTSKILSAKSDHVLRESHETQNELQIEEVPPEEDVEPGEFDNLSDEEDDYQDFLQDMFVPSHQNGEGCENDVYMMENGLADLEMAPGEFESQTGVTINEVNPTHSFFKEDKEGMRYLSSPVRKVYRKIDFSDLGRALVNTLKHRINKPKKKKKKSSKEISEGELAAEILPDTILEKTKDKKAQIEECIENMYSRVISKYNGENPIPFVNMIDEPSRKTIVETLLYLLHLTNRKKIQLWQACSPEDKDSFETENGEKKPNSERDLNSKENRNLDINREDGGINIYITPNQSTEKEKQ